MASHEQPKTTNGLVRKLGILALGASVALAACGTTAVRSGTVQIGGERESVLRDPANPSW